MKVSQDTNASVRFYINSVLEFVPCARCVLDIWNAEICFQQKKRPRPMLICVFCGSVIAVVNCVNGADRMLGSDLEYETIQVLSVDTDFQRGQFLSHLEVTVL